MVCASAWKQVHYRWDTQVTFLRRVGFFCFLLGSSTDHQEIKYVEGSSSTSWLLKPSYSEGKFLGNHLLYVCLVPCKILNLGGSPTKRSKAIHNQLSSLGGYLKWGLSTLGYSPCTDYCPGGYQLYLCISDNRMCPSGATTKWDRRKDAETEACILLW